MNSAGNEFSRDLGIDQVTGTISISGTNLRSGEASCPGNASARTFSFPADWGMVLVRPGCRAFMKLSPSQPSAPVKSTRFVPGSMIPLFS